MSVAISIYKCIHTEKRIDRTDNLQKKADWSGTLYFKKILHLSAAAEIETLLPLPCLALHIFLNVCYSAVAKVLCWIENIQAYVQCKDFSFSILDPKHQPARSNILTEAEKLKRLSMAGHIQGFSWRLGIWLGLASCLLLERWSRLFFSLQPCAAESVWYAPSSFSSFPWIDRGSSQKSSTSTTQLCIFST